MPVDFDIDLFLDQNRGNKPPYACPVEECGKVFKKWASLEHHMEMHRPADDDCMSVDGVDDAPDGSAAGAKATPGRKPRPGTEGKLDGSGNRRRRRSMSPPSSIRIMKTHDSLSFADSQKFVTFDTGSRRQRFSIYNQLKIIWIESNEAVKQQPMSPSPAAAAINGEEKPGPDEKPPVAVKMEVVDAGSPLPTSPGPPSTSGGGSNATPSTKNKKTPSVRRGGTKIGSNKKPSRIANRLVGGASRNSMQMLPHASPKLPEVDFEVMNDSLMPTSPPSPPSPVSRNRVGKRASGSTEEVADGYIVYIEPTNEELDELVEYDIDEEDEIWLEAMNQERTKNGQKPVTEETFEYILDRFEKEAEFTTSSNPTCCGFGGHRNKSNSIDDDAVCAICLDGTCENTNAILFCDMCNLAVHQECYGVPYIPEGQWLCRRCLHSPSKAVECVLCPNKGGAFKKTVDDRWAHVTCALWIPEVIFANPVFLEPIDNLDNIPNARWRLNCYICRQRGLGACIQCHKNSCYAAFHVTCAQQAGLYMKIEGIRDRGDHGTTLNVKKTAFCDAHSPADHVAGAMYAHSDDDSGPPSAERAAQLQKARMRQARKILAERRNSTPAVSVPVVRKPRLQTIHGALADAFDSDADRLAFLEALYNFWTLKRGARNGVPLLRRLQAASNQQSRGMHGLMMVCDEEAKQLRAQMKFWQRLRQDLEKARLLSELIRKREKLKKEVFRVQAMTLELRLQPFVCFLKKLIAKLQEFDKECIFAEPVSDADVPGYSKAIKKPMDLSTMRKKANNHDYTSLKALENDVKLMVSNCMYFNHHDSVYYKAAVRLRDKAAVLFREGNEMLSKLDFDLETGLHRCDLELHERLKAERENLKLMMPEELGSSVNVDALCALSPEGQLRKLCDLFERQSAASAALNASGPSAASTLRRLGACIDAVRQGHQLAESLVPERVRVHLQRLQAENGKEAPSEAASDATTVAAGGNGSLPPDSDGAEAPASEKSMQPPVRGSRRRSRASKSIPPTSPLPPLVLDGPTTSTPVVARKRPPASPCAEGSVGGSLKRRRISSRSTASPRGGAAAPEDEDSLPPPLLEKSVVGDENNRDTRREVNRRTSPRRQSSCATDSSAGGLTSPLATPTTPTSPAKPSPPSSAGPTTRAARHWARSRLQSNDEPPPSGPSSSSTSATLSGDAPTRRQLRRRRGQEETQEAEEEELCPPPPTLEPCASPALISPSLEASLRHHPAAFTAYRSTTAEDDLEDSSASLGSRRKGGGHARSVRDVGSPENELEDEEESRGGEGSSFASSLDSVLKKSSATAAAAAAAATPSCSGTHSTAGSAGTLCCGSESAGYGANGMAEEMEEMEDEEEVDDDDMMLEGGDSETDERGTVSSAGDMHLEPLDLVWAKCRGYPWYPGLIIDPDMPRDGYTHNGVPIPVPPEAVLESGRKSRHRRPFLVLFFDQKRTWQWLSRDKLEPLGVDSQLDLYLMHQTRRSVQKKSVRKAYENAVEHLCKVNGRPYPFTDGHDLSPYHQT